MHFFPVNLNIHDRKVVIVGGGAVAARKCATLLQAGAAVELISPAIDDALTAMWNRGSISCKVREYAPGDLAGACLAFAATSDEAVNRAVAEEAHARGIPVNVASNPDAGTFTLPASLSRGDLLITVSTGGRCPALAAELCRELSAQFGEEYGPVVHLLGVVREKLLTEKEGSAYNKGLLSRLVRSNMRELYKNNDFAGIDRLLLKLFGPGYSLADLGVKEKDFNE